MSLGLIGRKIGMMRIFTDAGVSIPVTVVDVSSNRVAQLKTLEQDGYTAVQLAYGSKRASRVVKAQAGHFAAASIEAASSLVEFRVDTAKLAELQVGSAVSAEIFAPGPATRGGALPAMQFGQHYRNISLWLYCLQSALPLPRLHGAV